MEKLGTTLVKMANDYVKRCSNAPPFAGSAADDALLAQLKDIALNVAEIRAQIMDLTCAAQVNSADEADGAAKLVLATDILAILENDLQLRETAIQRLGDDASKINASTRIALESMWTASPYLKQLTTLVQLK